MEIFISVHGPYEIMNYVMLIKHEDGAGILHFKLDMSRGFL